MLLTKRQVQLLDAAYYAILYAAKESEAEELFSLARSLQTLTKGNALGLDCNSLPLAHNL